jgi:hypothetical protein
MWTKEDNRLYQKNWRRKKRLDPEFRIQENERSKNWKRENVHKSRAAASDWHRQLKIEVLTHYCGGTPYCQCPSGLCQIVDIRFLTVDHPNNDGASHRKLIGRTNLYRWLQKNNYPKGFRVLCWNCNCGRFHNNGICPHEAPAREDLAKS